MDDKPNSDNSHPTKTEISPPIHLLPNELLVKIIEKLPRTQWPALELIDKKFRDAVLLAWGSIREVNIERDFIYSALKMIEGEITYDYEMTFGRLCLQFVRKTEAILKKLIDYSPLITSLSGLSMIIDDPALNTTTVQYLAEFEYLETIKFTTNEFSNEIVNHGQVRFSWGIPLVNLAEFMESTRSRATLKEIDIEHCRIPFDRDPIMQANIDRLRAAFANVPTRQSLQLESLSMQDMGIDPLTFLDTIDMSRMTKLSLGQTAIEPAVLTNLINGALRLRHLDFAFLKSCDDEYTQVCQGEHRQPNKELLAALASHQQLTSLGFNSIWSEEDCECHQFEEEFKKMLRSIGPQLVNFAFNPKFLSPDVRMGEIRDIIQRHMPQLKSIELGECCAKDPEDLRGIADNKELEEIKIALYCYSIFDGNYMAIVNEVLSTIINKSPRLKRFTGVHFRLDQRVVVELCKLTEVVDLRICAARLTTESFVAFSQQLFVEKLQVLHLGRIGEGVGSGLIEFVGKATQLRELMAYGNVTDQLLECLAESCPNLEKLRAGGKDGITFNGVQMFVDRCPTLRWLSVDNRARTFKSSLKELKLDPYRKLKF